MDDRHTIRCPVCGAGTLVTETRLAGEGVRRRRRCRHRMCLGRVTTYEFVTKHPRAWSHSDPVLVPAAELERALEILAS